MRRIAVVVIVLVFIVYPVGVNFTATSTDNPIFIDQPETDCESVNCLFQELPILGSEVSGLPGVSQLIDVVEWTIGGTSNTLGEALDAINNVFGFPGVRSLPGASELEAVLDDVADFLREDPVDLIENIFIGIPVAFVNQILYIIFEFVIKNVERLVDQTLGLIATVLRTIILDPIEALILDPLVEMYLWVGDIYGLDIQEDPDADIWTGESPIDYNE